VTGEPAGRRPVVVLLDTEAAGPPGAVAAAVEQAWRLSRG
jgi:hypothetical protein